MKRLLVLISIIPIFGCNFPEVPKPKINAAIIVRESDVLVMNNDSFAYNDCLIKSGGYKTTLNYLAAGKSETISWSKFKMPLIGPDPAHASIGNFNPLIVDCIQGRWKGGIE